MSTVLEGIRVIDLGTGPASGIATMILADFGAEVLRIDPPGGDPFEALPGAPLWLRGKSRLTLDLKDPDRDSFDALCAGADVLVCNQRPAALRRLGLDWDTLHSRFPHLNVCHITGFGPDGPSADIPGYEHVVAAKIGRMQIFRGIADRPGPVFSALQVGIHACAQSAVTGILAALVAQGSDGEGQLVETSLVQGMIAYEQGAMLGAQFRERFPEMFPALQSTSDAPPLPSLYYHPAQAADGKWMQFGNLLPHLFDNFLIVTGLVDVIADPDWNPAQMRLPDDKHEAFRDRMLATIQSRTSDEWMADFISDGGVVATTYQTTQEAIDDPDIVANGHAIRVGDATQLGPVARLSEHPATPGREPEGGETLGARWSESKRAAPTRNHSPAQPLAGIKVVEIATIIAAPMSASFLADMGAEVIKVEQIGGDPYRGLGAGVGAARVNGGKRSISVNLKSETAQAVVRELLRDADVMIHNYRPGVPERLGIGYEQVRELNPDIVYVQANGYGPDGPGALRPSTHPIPGAAMGGVLYQMGERVPHTLQDAKELRQWTSRLMRANEVNPDPNTALVIASATLLGLAARSRHGRGQMVMTDMFGANAYANADDFLTYPGKAPRLMPDEGLHGLSANYRLYACDAETWLFVAIPLMQEQQRFVEVLGKHDIASPSIETLGANDASTVEALSRLFASRPAPEWEAMLAPAGLGCVQADACTPADYYLNDSQAAALDLHQGIDHPVWGEYQRHGALIRFNRKTPELKPPPYAGQHNHEVLITAGVPEGDLDALLQSGTIWQEPVKP